MTNNGTLVSVENILKVFGIEIVKLQNWIECRGIFASNYRWWYNDKIMTILYHLIKHYETVWNKIVKSAKWYYIKGKICIKLSMIILWQNSDTLESVDEKFWQSLKQK